MPWCLADAIRAAGLILVGAIVWFVGWYQVSARAAMGEQIGPMNFAVVGLLIVGTGQASWFLAGRRAVGARRRSLLGATAKPSPVAGTAAVDLFAGSERLYHRLECGMATDRRWAPVPRSDHERQGRTPCGVCAP
jgi:hypothetical protein